MGASKVLSSHVVRWTCLPARSGAALRDAPLPPRSMSSGFRLPGFAALPRQPAHIRVTKDGTEVDSVPVSDKAILFGRKVTAPPTSTPALPSPPCAGTQTDRQTHTWLQVKHAPKLGTYRLDHMSVSQEHAPPAGEAEALIGSACSYNRAPTLVLEAHWALGDSALPAGESRPKGVQPPPTSIAASR